MNIVKGLPLNSEWNKNEKDRVTVGIKQLWEDYKGIVTDCPNMTFEEYILARRQAITELSKEEAPLKNEIIEARIEIVN